MSSLWKRSMVWLGLEEEPVEDAGGLLSQDSDSEAAAVETQSVAMPLGQEASLNRGSLFNGGGTVRTIHSPDLTGDEIGVRTIPASSEPVQVVEAMSFNDAQKIGERFRAGQPVLIDLRQVERDSARRIVDFASGLTFALRGSMQKVGEQLFLVKPSNVEISSDELERLRRRGVTGEQE